MDKRIIALTVFCSLVLLIGCSKEKSYRVWVDATQGKKTVDSAIERLNNAEIDFIIDDNNSILINEKDMDKAVMCCS